VDDPKTRSRTDGARSEKGRDLLVATRPPISQCTTPRTFWVSGHGFEFLQNPTRLRPCAVYTATTRDTDGGASEKSAGESASEGEVFPPRSLVLSSCRAERQGPRSLPCVPPRGKAARTTAFPGAGGPRFPEMHIRPSSRTTGRETCGPRVRGPSDFSRRRREDRPPGGPDVNRSSSSFFLLLWSSSFPLSFFETGEEEGEWTSERAGNPSFPSSPSSSSSPRTRTP